MAAAVSEEAVVRAVAEVKGTTEPSNAVQMLCADDGCSIQVPGCSSLMAH